MPECHAVWPRALVFLLSFHKILTHFETQTLKFSHFSKLHALHDGWHSILPVLTSLLFILSPDIQACLPGWNYSCVPTLALRLPLCTAHRVNCLKQLVCCSKSLQKMRAYCAYMISISKGLQSIAIDETISCCLFSAILPLPTESHCSLLKCIITFRPNDLIA